MMVMYMRSFGRESIKSGESHGRIGMFVVG